MTHSGARVLARATGCAIALSLICAAIPSYATQQRTFIASTGVDSGGCQRATPCRELAYAQNQTSDGGEIVILDSAEYAGLTVGKSISIVAAPGIQARLLPSGGSSHGVLIAANGVAVSLRGLVFGSGGIATGITIDSDSNVVVVDGCTIRDWFQGVQILGAGSRVLIRDSAIELSARNGVLITGDDASVVLNRVRIGDSGGLGGASAILFSAGVGLTSKLAVRDSVVAGNNGAGLEVGSAPGRTASVTVERSLFTGNTGFGVDTSGTGMTVMVGASTLAENAAGGARSAGGASVTASGNAILRNGGPGFVNADASSTFRSFADNALEGNNGGGAQTSGTIVVLPKQ